MMEAALQITENSQIADARRRISAHARDLGFDETRIGALAITITEVTTNLVKHAGGGELIIRSLEESGALGIELLAIDKGPGMRDVAECLRDGYSTKGSPGTGLGAIIRMSDESDIYSTPDKGSVVMARIWNKPPEHRPRASRALLVEGFSIPLQQELACGDAWACSATDDHHVIMVADGLGHGPLAASASRAAVEAFQESAERDVATIIADIHGALRSTRGAAVAVAKLDRSNATVHYAGVGNIAALIYTPEKTQRMVSHNGTVGHTVRKIQEFTYAWPQGATLVISSDGISSQLSLAPYSYQNLTHHHPSLVAAVLYRDFGRGRDDSTVVVAQERER